VTLDTRRCWHYTVGTTLLSIIVDGVIRRATVGVRKGGSRPAVWFSCRDGWEPTATKWLRDDTTGQPRLATVDEMVHAGRALIRLEVPLAVARHTWREHRRRHEDPRIADALEQRAREQGADPDDWRVSYYDVSLHDVISIESWTVGMGTWDEVGRYDEETGGLALAGR
jgi:hypothetical protein